MEGKNHYFPLGLVIFIHPICCKYKIYYILFARNKPDAMKLKYRPALKFDYHFYKKTL